MDTYKEDAKRIFKEFKQKCQETAFSQLTIEQQLAYFQKNYYEFNKNFPIVLRYMIQLKKFHMKAFEKFIKKMLKSPYRNKDEYCMRQADYIKYLYMETTSHYQMDDAQSVWTTAYDALKKEVEVFDKAEEIVKEKLEKNNAVDNISRREELKAVLKTLHK